MHICTYYWDRLAAPVIACSDQENRAPDPCAVVGLPYARGNRGGGGYDATRYIREVTSRIDKDLKGELRQTAFEMWMGCYSQQEIAAAVGFAQQSIAEFIKNLPLTENGTDAENGNLAENPALTSELEREFFDNRKRSA